MADIIFPEESYQIVGACFDVYNVMGVGFLEPVYQECLAREFQFCHVPFIPQPELTLTYKGAVLTQTYRPDFICYDQIIVEIKAVKEIADEHRAQTFNYLRASGFRLGLLVNFGHYPKATVERIIK